MIPPNVPQAGSGPNGLEVSMRTGSLTALLAVFIAGLVSVAPLIASAETTFNQSVPLPKPSPERVGGASDEVVRPPGTVGGNGPVSSGLPTTLLPPSTGESRTNNLAQTTPATTFDAKQRARVDRVSGYLSGVQTLVGDFVQVGPDGTRTEGQFYIQKPGKVRFEYNPPSPIDVIADGQSVVVRNRVLATQDLYPLSQTPLRFLLSDKIDLMKDTNVISVSADEVFVTIVIEEKQPIVGTSRLMMMFGAKDFQLRQWTVSDPQGYDTTVAVYNLDMTSKPDPGMFKITYERTLQ
jgi:outer membrane lipoprotein-sorting protein